MAKVDLHIHSKHSDRPTEWFLQKLGSGESYTEPETVYQLAKKRGMAYVTITDHNVIKGSLELAEKYNDAFSGVEATAYFPEDSCKIHILIYGLNGNQFEEVQHLRHDIYQLRDYIVEQRLAHSIAHATHSLNNKLTKEHLEKLVILFDVFEVINGGRSKSSNGVWYSYLETLDETKFKELQTKHGIKPQRSNSWEKGFTGGSNDHAGIFIGQTYTMAGAKTTKDFLAYIRDRKGIAKGRSNDFQSLAFTVYKVAHDYSRGKSQPFIHSLPLSNLGDLIFGERKVSLIDRLSVLFMKADANIAYKQRIAELINEIRREKITSPQRNLNLFYDKIAELADEVVHNLIETVQKNLKKGDAYTLVGNLSSALPGLFLLIPFFTSFKYLNNNRQLLTELNAENPEKPHRKILWFTDTLNDLNGVSVTLKRLGWEFYAHGIDVRIATALLKEELSEDLPPNTMNLPIVATFRLPYYERYIIKIPSLLQALKELQEFEPDEIFVSTPGPMGLLGVIAARLTNIPVTGIYHTDFTKELEEIDGDEAALEMVEAGTRWFYSLMDEIKVPTKTYMDILEKRGLDRSKMSVFPRQIDHETFSYHPPEEWNGARIDLPEGLNLLDVGRVSKDKSLEFLVDVFREVRKRKDAVNLIVAGDGPYLEEMKSKLSEDKRVVFTGPLPYESLPLIYSQAHALVFPSVTDTFGMVVLEAQCCELPAIVSDQGGPKEIIKDGETGFVLPALVKNRWVKAILELDDLIQNKSEQYQELRRKARQSAIQWTGWEAVLKGLTREELQPKPKLMVD